MKESRQQYSIFLEKLEELVQDKDVSTLDSKDLIKTFLNNQLNLYKGIEMIMYIICTDCVALSV